MDEKNKIYTPGELLKITLKIVSNDAYYKKNKIEFEKFKLRYELGDYDKSQIIMFSDIILSNFNKVLREYKKEIPEGIRKSTNLEYKINTQIKEIKDYISNMSNLKEYIEKMSKRN